MVKWLLAVAVAAAAAHGTPGAAQADLAPRDQRGGGGTVAPQRRFDPAAAAPNVPVTPPAALQPTPAAPAVAAPAVAAPAVAAPAAVSPTLGPPPNYAEVMATAEKPKGFAYHIMREAVVDDVRDTYLYIKSSPQATNSITVPIPKNRELLATCIKGGTFDDLAHGAIVTVRYDPAGAVRPEIEIIEKVVVEIYDDAKVLDRGGRRLYVRAPDGREKGFNLEGGTAAWDEVIEGAKFVDLVPGTTVRVEHDPGGRKPIRVIFKKKAEEMNADGSKKIAGRGCGCDTRGDQPVPLGAVWFGALTLGAVAIRRRMGD